MWLGPFNPSYCFSILQSFNLSTPQPLNFSTLSLAYPKDKQNQGDNGHDPKAGMAEGCFRVWGGLDRFRLERLRVLRLGGKLIDGRVRLLLREQGGMNLAAFGDGFRLGHSLLDVAYLLFCDQRDVFIRFNHGSAQCEISRQERVWGGREASIGRPSAFDMLPLKPE